MLPRLLSVEGGRFLLHLNGYGFSIFCGTLAALFVVLRRARTTPLPLRRLLAVFMIGIAGGFLGARLAFSIQYGRTPFSGGWVLYGGLLGGMASGLLAARRLKLPPLAVADLATPGLLLAAAFGRLGCFFAGCCFGAVRDGGLSYPADSHAWRSHVAAGLLDPKALRSLPTLPMPLLEAAALFVFFAASSRIWTRGGRPGRTLAAGGLLYSAWRFGAEFWRGDHDAYWGTLLTFSQGVSIAVFAASLLILRLKSAPAPAGVPGRGGWIAAGQAAAILLGVTALTGGIGCSASQRYEVANDVAEDCIDDCLDDCIGSCTDACTDACTKKFCQEKADNPKPKKTGESPWLRVPRIEPGSHHSGRMTLQATLNERTVLLLQIGAEIDALGKEPSGAQSLLVTITELEIQLNELSVKSGAGTLEVRIDAAGHAAIRASKMPVGVLSILKAVEPLSQGFLSVALDAPPAKEWTDLVMQELKVPGARGECRGHLVLNDGNYPFEATAHISDAADGGKRVQWLLRRTPR